MFHCSWVSIWDKKGDNDLWIKLRVLLGPSVPPHGSLSIKNKNHV